MIHDSIQHLERIETDICIIGSGAAGLVLASEFFNTDTRVCVLESGKSAAMEDDPLYTFETNGLNIAHDSRTRVLGGTTTKWSGRWKALDEIDFSVRGWIANSGWPLSLHDLAPYYERASRLFGVKMSSDALPTYMPSLKDSALEYTSFNFVDADKRDLGRYLGNTLRNSKNISVYLDSHVTHLQEKAGTIGSVVVKDSSGKEYAVHSAKFILAAGGIENPRMLLASGIGNDYDQVGRYYMDHPKGAAGVIETYQPVDLSESAFIMNTSVPSFGIRMSDTYQRSEGILDTHIYLEPLKDLTLPMRLFNKIAPSRHSVSSVALVRNYLEQAPDASNRVSLSDARDAFGIPRARVTWNIGETDMKTMYRFHELLRTEFPRLGIGEFRSPLLEHSASFPLRQDASHHMGTTRMGNDPRNSVADANGKVHGIENLYVAGSSVFPTGGAAGPVATIAALAIRLADHLKTYA